MLPWQHCQAHVSFILCRCGPEMDPKRVQDAAKNQSAEKIEFGALQPDGYRHHQLPTKDGLS